MALEQFHPIVRTWFARRFGEPTEAQALGWPAIAQGKHTLIAAPTGSGKTLAAFLTAIDSLVREGLEGALPDATQVVYVSPLKALSNDVHRNLEEPLAEILALAAEMGTPLPEIRTAVRTGDTSSSERQRIAKRPPHILITTPESLYILMTSERGRSALKGVRTLILDELHAVVGNKRGSHLSLTVERLCHLVEAAGLTAGSSAQAELRRYPYGPVAPGPFPAREGGDGRERPAITRIGLSATQRPIEEVARFLVGTGGRVSVRGEALEPRSQASTKDGAWSKVTTPSPADSSLVPPPDGLSLGGERQDGIRAEDGVSAKVDGFPLTRQAPLAQSLPTSPSGGEVGMPPSECTIVNTGHKRKMDVQLELPEGFELGPVATHELWAQVLDQIAQHIKAHRTTLLFVNTRRLVERVAHLISERIGEEHVVAHHGSLSRETRFDAEQRLKAGTVKVCVATASLELGIDIGDVDLVCQIGSPRSIGTTLQRIGRSNHSVTGMPKGRLYPLTRDELIETIALLRAIHQGELDRLSIPPWPLDILSQQIVAATSCEDWNEDALFDLVRRAYPYAELPREQYDRVIATLSEGIANRWGRGSAYLHRDGVHGVVKARKGARITAVTSGGAIPDNADYAVIMEPEGTFVGTVNEDFAVESMAGDVFLLGNTPWKVRRVESSGVVRVESAQGQAPTLPFWLGEAPGRTWELSQEIGQVRLGIDERLSLPVRGEALEPQGQGTHLTNVGTEDGTQAKVDGSLRDASSAGGLLSMTNSAAVAWLMQIPGVGLEAATQAVEYIAEGKRVLGIVPTGKRVVAERFFDEAGGMQLVVHAPFGARINRAWGMALRKRFCRTFDFELQAAATDDGINISLGPQHSFPVEDVFNYIKSNTVDDVLLQAVFQSPLFGTRWRWDATRFLALIRQTGGKKVPAALQRMRSDDLLAAVFPAQASCQDNRLADDVEPPDHPLVFETIRDCLTEALDSAGLKRVLGAIEREEIEVYGRDTLQPSVFSHQLLNAAPYAFLDDAPLEERRARAVTLRRALPEDSRDLGALDPEAIRFEEANAWPPVRDRDELHDLLLTLGVMAQEDVTVHAHEPAVWHEWFDALVKEGRAVRVYANLRTTTPSPADGSLESPSDGLSLGGERQNAPTHRMGSGLRRNDELWSATERVPALKGIYPDAHIEPEVKLLSAVPEYPEVPLAEFVKGRSECIGPFTAEGLAATLRLSPATVLQAIARLEMEGLLLRGHFRNAAPPTRALGMLDGETEFCNRRILARIHRSTISKLRQEIEPVEPATYIRFLLQWQHATPSSRLAGEAGLAEVVDKLQGFEASASAWESGILPARVADYVPAMLDHLCFAGEIVWGRFAPREAASAELDLPALTRHHVISLGLRDELPWLLQRDDAVERPALNGAAFEVLEYLQAKGASFLPDIVANTRRLPSEVEEALWQLVWAGYITADGFGPLRGLVTGATKRLERASRFGKRTRERIHSSRWSLLQAAPIEEDVVEARAAQLLRRYGIVVREILGREPMAPSWRDLLRVYRRAEARGEIRGGRFVAGLVGEQFALPESVEALRALRKHAPSGEVVRLSASDPLNLVGILTPGPRIPALPGNEVVYRDGVPVVAG